MLKRKTPIKKSTKALKRTAIKRKPIEQRSSKGQAKPIREKSNNVIPKLLDKLERVFHTYIRNRDTDPFEGATCISCGEYVNQVHAQAGHYMPSTYSVLKFNEFNTSLECMQCNIHDPNHLVGYRKNLIKKIGIEKVLWLESHKISEVVKWDRDILEGLIKKYSK